MNQLIECLAPLLLLAGALWTTVYGMRLCRRVLDDEIRKAATEEQPSDQAYEPQSDWERLCLQEAERIDRERMR